MCTHNINYAAATDDDLKVFVTEDEALNYAETRSKECFVAAIGESL